MGVQDHEIGRNLVAGDSAALRHPRQHPSFPAALHGSSRLVDHALAQQVVRELEGVDAGEDAGGLHRCR